MDLSGGGLETIVGLSSTVVVMAGYIARQYQLHSREVAALNARHKEALEKADALKDRVQEARVAEMRVVTEAAITLKATTDTLHDAVDKLVELEKARGRYR